ncbi:hypothetical protein SVIO_080390 [Streptomyces violaceusniger]|uniref:FAD/NAD(P)-binding domain-containing protein n=1 Tax=Streptomyces violaceusniger TaxID=68280 RepID=A0A4D4LDW5_STRVO|nr:hypothetical protein SVIO_080390 [Streptomyces violaceusniger]
MIRARERVAMNQATDEYDVIVLGAGPVGENLADRTRAAGLSTVIVERELVGGECSYWACVPSKSLLRPVLARAEARQVPGVREAVGGRWRRPMSSPTATSRSATGRTTVRSPGWSRPGSTWCAAMGGWSGRGGSR